MFIFTSPCEFKGEFFHEFLIGLKYNDSAITGLDIRGEDLSPTQFVDIFKELKHNTTVKNLILRGRGYNCDLSNETISVGLSDLLRDNKTIDTLTLYFTGINDQGIKHITSALGNNSTLTYLKIWGHELNLEGELSLVKMLANNKTIEEIIINHLSPKAGLVILSQLEYLNPSKYSVVSSYNSFSQSIISQDDKLDEPFMIRNKERKLIEEEVREKTRAVNNLLMTLERQNFSDDFIKVTKDFCLNNFLIKHNNIINQYQVLSQEHKTALIELENAYMKAPMGTIKISDKVTELEKYYDDKQSELFNRFNEIQYKNLKLFVEAMQQISNQDKVVKLRNHKITTDSEQTIVAPLVKHDNKILTVKQNEVEISANEKLDGDAQEIKSEIEHESGINTQIVKKPVKILRNDEFEVPIIEVVNDNEIKPMKNEPKKPVVKKLSVNEELQGTEYVTAWAQKVIEAEYDTVVFSVGSNGKIEQQLPSFSKGLGKVAILNIDRVFQISDIQNISKFDNISVNYLKAPLQTPERNKTFVTAKQRENYKEDPSTITQEALIDNICKLMDSRQKVILISHISVQAPRLFFDKILSHPDIMNKYEKDFIFIHSYSETAPSIICSKNFISSMISPSSETMSKYLSTHEPVSKDMEVVKDDIFAEKILEAYDQSEHSSAKSLKLSDDATIYHSLFQITAEDIMPMLGLNENSFFDSDSFLQ